MKWTLAIANMPIHGNSVGPNALDFALRVLYSALFYSTEQYMAQLRTIAIEPRIFAKLQQLAVPLIDDVGSVIEKLVAHWEKDPPSLSINPQDATAEQWRTLDGDLLRVGEVLQTKYLRKHFTALVRMHEIEFDGVTYPSLSAAGRAVKRKCGRIGSAAATNGRQFWKAKNAAGQLVKVGDRTP